MRTLIAVYFVVCSFIELSQGLHTPASNIPAFIGEHGMPIGISLVGRKFGDQQLLSVASALSKVLMAEGGCKPSRT